MKYYTEIILKILLYFRMFAPNYWRYLFIIMNISKLLLAVSMAAITSTFTLHGENKADIVDYVNPLIGASTSTEAGKSLHGLGKTFPGPTTPFGLIQKTSTAFSPNSSPSNRQWREAVDRISSWQ